MSKIFVNIGLNLDGYMARAGSTTCFATPPSASVPTSWASECSTKASARGRKRWLGSLRGNRDIRIAGGANVIQQYLNMSVIDELEIAMAPVLFCGGRRLFENLDEPGQQFRIDRIIDSPSATHLRYVRQ